MGVKIQIDWRRYHVGKICLALLLLWLAFAGACIWHYANIEIEPPVWDSLTYAMKAKAFWHAVAAHIYVNPLSIEPTIRPIGTVLMSYPFGYSDHYGIFYFRSLFLPLMLFAFSVILTCDVMVLSNKQKIVLFAIALTAASVPCHFNFQLRDAVEFTGGWGYVDNFLAGLTGVATALVVSDRRIKSAHVAFGVSVLCVLLVLVKPAAISLIAVILLGFGLTLFFRVKQRRETTGDFFKAASIVILILGSAGVWIFFSDYLTPAQIHDAIVATEVLKRDFYVPPTLGHIFHLLQIGTGIPLLLIMCLGIVAVLRARAYSHGLISLLLLLTGFWLWLVQTGIQEIRYFVPFMFAATIALIPALIEWSQFWSMRVTTAFVAVVVASPILIGYLLVSDTPPEGFQHFLGVGLQSNAYANEVHQAEVLNAHLSKENGGVKNVYLCGVTPPLRAFEAVLDWHDAQESSRRLTRSMLPLDWAKESAFRMDDLVNANFIVFEPKSLRANDAIRNTDEVNSYQDEETILRAWLSSLGDKDGIQIRSETKVRLIEIVDDVLFDEAISNFYSRHKWRTAAHPELQHGFSALAPATSAYNLTDGNWIKGVGRNTADFFVENTRVNLMSFQQGKFIKFSNGEARALVKVEQSGRFLNIYVSGAPLDGNVVGFPNKIEIVK